MTPGPIDPSWAEWLNSVWPTLEARGHLPVPPVLPHPGAAGFAQPLFAEPQGQVRDYVYSVADGSRVHLHEYADGAMVAHRDASDPHQGVLPALRHLAFETVLGRTALLTLLGVGIAMGLRYVGVGRPLHVIRAVEKAVTV